jgi:hypothetical protein
MNNISALRRNQVPQMNPVQAYQRSLMANEQLLQQKRQAQQRDEQLAERARRNRALEEQSASSASALESYRTSTLDQGQQRIDLSAEQETRLAEQYSDETERARQAQLLKVQQWIAEGQTTETDALTGQQYTYNPRSQAGQQLLETLGYEAGAPAADPGTPPPAGVDRPAPGFVTGQRAPQYPQHVIDTNAQKMGEFQNRQTSIPQAVADIDQFDRFLTPLISGQDYNLGPIESELQQRYPARLLGTDAQKRTDELGRFGKERVLDMAENLKGALSDRDIKFLVESVPGENAEEDEWINYLYEAKARLMTAQELQRQQQNYVNKNGHLIGFDETRARTRIRDQFMGNQKKYMDEIRSQSDAGLPVNREQAWITANKPW